MSCSSKHVPIEAKMIYNIVLGCVHDQKAQWVLSIGVANKNARSWALPNNSKHSEDGFSTVWTNLLCL